MKTKVFLFTLRLSYSGKTMHRAFGSQGQEAFPEGHLVAFHEVLGGNPAEREERSSIAIASNESFSGWTKTFTGNIIETGTASYRLAHARSRRAAGANP